MILQHRLVLVLFALARITRPGSSTLSKPTTREQQSQSLQDPKCPSRRFAQCLLPTVDVMPQRGKHDRRVVLEPLSIRSPPSVGRCRMPTFPRAVACSWWVPHPGRVLWPISSSWLNPDSGPEARGSQPGHRDLIDGGACGDQQRSGGSPIPMMWIFSTCSGTW